MKLRDILNILNEVQQKHSLSKAYIVGGCARDKYMNKLKNISDIDLCTGNDDAQRLAYFLFKELDQKYDVSITNHKDNHVTLNVGNLKIDFSSNFIVDDVEKYLNIENPTELQKEIFSRDFTCNTLLLDFDLKTFYDITGRATTDINNKIIKTCLSPEITLDPNRIIRSIYLACKLNFTISPDIIEYVKAHPELVKNANKKLIFDKLSLAFTKDKNLAKKLLTEMNLWNYLPIEIQKLKDI